VNKTRSRHVNLLVARNESGAALEQKQAAMVQIKYSVCSVTDWRSSLPKALKRDKAFRLQASVPLEGGVKFARRQGHLAGTTTLSEHRYPASSKVRRF